MIGNALWVDWTDSTQRRFTLGVLSRDTEVYRFTPEHGFKHAVAAGFWSPELEAAADGATMSSRFLFRIFAEQIPARGRSDFQEIMRDWGVVNDTDSFEILVAGSRRPWARVQLRVAARV